MESFFEFLSSLVPWDILLGWLFIAVLVALVFCLLAVRVLRARAIAETPLRSA